MAAWTKILYTGDAATELTGTAYQLLYIDSAGDVQELAHGTSTHVLTSNGASSDPTWQAAASGAHALAAGQTDVTVTTPADHEVLAYNTGVWINETAAEAGLATTSHEGSHEVGGGDELVDGATSPSTTSNTAASGTATKPPRMDHVHALGTGSVDDSTIDIASGVIGVKDSGIGNAQMNGAATDIALNQVILTPKATGDGTTEGTVFYDSDDDHLYVYVV